MKRVLSSILCALGFAAVAAPAAITPARFTDEFVEAVRKALPAYSVTHLDVLRLRISDSSGKEIATEFLDNAYDEYTTDPSTKDDIIRRHLASLVEIASAGAQLGAPLWIQGDETPICDCGERMTFVAQLESTGGGGINFGDSGAGYAFVCRECEASAKFLWQCS